MASFTIGNLDHQFYEQLRIAADSNGRSVEEEARLILTNALAGGLGTRISNRFGADAGVELELPSR